MTPVLEGARVGLLTASASRLGGGVFEVVVAQADLLRQLAAEPVILALDDDFAARDEARFRPGEVHRAAVLGPRQFRARLAAAAKLVVVLPSPGWAEVTSITCGRPSEVE